MSRKIDCELTILEAELFDDIMGHTDVGPDVIENEVFNSMLEKLKYQKKPNQIKGGMKNSP